MLHLNEDLLQHADSISFQICRVILIVWTFSYESRHIDSAILRKESLTVLQDGCKSQERDNLHLLMIAFLFPEAIASR